MKRIGIVGGTGYTGVELMRLLSRHPEAEVAVITSRSEAGTRVDRMFPNLRGVLDLEFTEPDIEALLDCDLVFYATPNGIAMQQAPELLDRGARVVDLAADFRLQDIPAWERWYGMTHACPGRVAEAVYGLPEINREAIRTARLVANPGCHVTAVTLGLLPLLEAGVVDSGRLIADSKSGASGAGRGAAVPTLLAEAGESFKPYAVSGHRHHPEICQVLGSRAGAGQPVGLTFVPHLVPMSRGIEASLYAVLTDTSVDVQALFETYYHDEPFVDVLPAGSIPETRSVRGSNFCRLAVHRPMDGDTVVVLSVIDNLVKGAAGQAVQNMNLMFGIDERAGLDTVALLP
ncbi:MAG: N-acetyl-gamma-glutamyl-phosphate reductase [Halothiobacillaceae bacterium]